MTAVSNKHLADGRLHRAVKLNAIGFNVASLHLEAADDRETLTLPSVIFHGRGRGSPLVVAYNSECRAGAFHYDASRALVAADPRKARALQRHDNRLEDSVVSAWQLKHAVNFVHGMLQRLSVVCFAVTLGSKILHVGHARNYACATCSLQ